MITLRQAAVFAMLALALAATWPVPAANAQTDSPKTDEPHSAVAPVQKTNPYLPRKGMSVEDLQAYIERMQEAPESIRNRPGFAAGIALAAQRILDTDPKGSLRTFALLNLMDSLHQQADLENDLDADTHLNEVATKYASDADKKVAATAQLYVLEQRVLKAQDLEPEKLLALLDEVKTALTDQQLDARHFRIASATVHAVNQIKDNAEARSRLKEFGALFAASANPELSRYGKKIAQAGSPETPQTDWVGKPMELSGPTADGATFDITKYKGKVVLVDFWATWCGPCRELLPDLKKMYEKLHTQGFEIVGVDLDGTPSDLADFLDKEKLPWVNVVGEEKDGQLQFPLAEKYEIHAIPTTFVVGRDGKIAAYDLHDEELAKQIETLLAEKQDGKSAGASSPEAKPLDAK